MGSSPDADYRSRFADCGTGVVVEPGVWIEHPELFSVGDGVRLGRGFYCQDAPRVTLAAGVAFYPDCFVQGRGELTVAAGVAFFPQTYVSTGPPTGFVRVGEHSHFAPGCALYGHGGLTVGRYCNVAAHVVLATVAHDPAAATEPMALRPSVRGPITCEDDVWLGANATVTGDTVVARGCIVGANAVLTRSTSPDGVYVGVPARRLRDRGPR